MCSSLSLSSTFFHLDTICNYRRFNVCFNLPAKRSLNCGILSYKKFRASRVPSDGNLEDTFGGWLCLEDQIDKKKGNSKSILLVGIATSVFILIGSIAITFSLTSKGLKYQFVAPFNTLLTSIQPILESVGVSSLSDVNSRKEKRKEDESDLIVQASDGKEKVTSSASVDKPKNVIPVAADTTQEEALGLLKKLQIVEDDIRPDELCSRREYARWLVKSSLLLERCPKLRIHASMLITDVIPAFDDVNVTDTDFWCIQALAETGIVCSKLSVKNDADIALVGNGTRGQERVEFYPDRYITRQDLVNWKAHLEYSSVPEEYEKMFRKRPAFTDVTNLNPTALPELFMDLMAGDKSIARNAFGNTRRFQSQKPATIGQVAVALSCGRFKEMIQNKLHGLEAENLSRKIVAEEIMSELIHRGEVQKHWEGKIVEEKSHKIEVENTLLLALDELDKERIIRDANLMEQEKSKAAIDCQRRLLIALRDDIDRISKKHSEETAILLAERQHLGKLSVDLKTKQEAILQTKSILEAEKEALIILKSWVEEEAKQSKERAKVLEEAERRWKWDENSGIHHTHSNINEET